MIVKKEKEWIRDPNTWSGKFYHEVGSPVREGGVEFTSKYIRYVIDGFSTESTEKIEGKLKGFADKVKISRDRYKISYQLVN